MSLSTATVALKKLEAAINEDAWITDAKLDLVFNAGNLADVSCMSASRCVVFHKKNAKAVPGVMNKALAAAFRDVVKASTTDKWTGTVSISLKIQRTIIYDVRINREAKYETCKA